MRLASWEDTLFPSWPKLELRSSFRIVSRMRREFGLLSEMHLVGKGGTAETDRDGLVLTVVTSRFAVISVRSFLWYV